MNKFQSSELFGAFLVFVAIFIIIILLEQFYQQCISNDAENLVYGRHHTLRFHFKKMVARMLLKFGQRKETPDDVVDKLQIFSDSDDMPVDAVFYNTSSPDRQILVFGMARRKNGLVNTMGFLRVPEFSKNLLMLPVSPYSSLYQTETEQSVLDSYTVAGIKITPVIPKKEYHLQYNGKMVTNSSERKEVDIQLLAVWRSNLPAFNFSTAISKIAMSEAMALEPWTRQYFDDLKSHHQIHYEQYGNVEGTVKIDGKEYSIKANGLRDRTIGAKRDWNDFHRYVIHWIHLDNGNAITIGVISVPVMFTRLVIGFISKANDNINIPIDSCSIDLKEFNAHDPPESYNFDFIANNDSYRVHVKTHTQTKIYMGEQSESCLTEKWCDFKVNGVNAWGAAEWQCRNEKSCKNS